MNFATAKAFANIALIKYWGKRDEMLMLPTKDSLSVTLESLNTSTNVSFGEEDRLLINGVEKKGEFLAKLVAFLSKFRKKFGINKYFIVQSTSNFPIAAGLSSSSSGFAAVTLALNDLCVLKLNKKELSMIARLGSGSASRSILNGFVIWHKGILDDGSDSFAEQLFASNHWPEFRIIVVVVQSEQKKVSSTKGMQITALTSKLYNDWLVRSEERLKNMIEAIKLRDIKSMGVLAEADCLDMHKIMQESDQSLNYFNEKTFSVIDLIKRLRNSGIECYFTVDAGPNVKIITKERFTENILHALKDIDGIEQTIVSKIA